MILDESSALLLKTSFSFIGEELFTHFFFLSTIAHYKVRYTSFFDTTFVPQRFFYFFVTLVGREKKISVAIESRCFILVALIKGVIHTFYFSFQC